jgi:methionyl-tRNA formyltransferase
VLEAILASQGAALLDETVGPWLRGEIAAQPQPDRGATLTRPLRRGDGRIDPGRQAAELERQVRAYQPWPGSFVDTPFGRLVVWSAVADDDGPAVGTFDELGLGVGTGERLRLIEVQPAGGRRMPWDDFLRGRPSIAGSAIEPGR